MGRTRQLHLTAKEVSLLLNRSLSYSYDVIAKMNAELESKGMYVMPGRISTQYFAEKFYGMEITDEMLAEIHKEISAEDAKRQQITEQQKAV